MLVFLHDPAISFANNLADHALRMAKAKQKILGAFRSSEGAKVFTQIYSLISTVRKQGHLVLQIH
ncbi:transposase [Aneurinibacillus migulanus]|nr:transposase [Aneurinibacillus migulanus]